MDREEYRQQIKSRIMKKYKELERNKELMQWSKCIWVEGQIFALESIVMDLTTYTGWRQQNELS